MMALSLSIVLVLFLQFSGQDCVTVSTKLGDVEGTEFTTVSGRILNAFLGVPYAEPPVGQYRFEEPRPIKKWDGTWMAKESSSVCLQTSSAKVFKGSEDCLYMDIYTPNTVRNSTFAVMVFFHGGSFKIGTGITSTPKFLLDNTDFIFITINYRLGPLGFLSTEDSVVPGNNGLKDQVMALKWVRDNIASFGGDPDKVTITGVSAGGASVHLHYFSPLSRGLFSKGISVSGCALNPWVLTWQSLSRAKRLAASLGCATDQTDVMVRCLKTKPGKQLISQLTPLFMPWIASPLIVFGPVIEVSGSSPFLSEHPSQLLLQRKVFDGPWLTSVTTEDGLCSCSRFIDRNQRLVELNDRWNDIAPHLLAFNFTCSQARLDNVSDIIKSHYFGVEHKVYDSTNKIIDMLSDRLFKADTAHAASLQATATKSHVFLLEYGYRANKSFTDYTTRTRADFGVSHKDDEMLIFGFLPSHNLSLEIESDRAMAFSLRDTWLSFMEHGCPSVGNGVVWQPVSPNLNTNNRSVSYLFIKSPNDMIMMESEDFGNFKFWDSLGLRENSHYIHDFKQVQSAGTKSKYLAKELIIMSSIFIYFYNSQN